jgi:hypothetical protein
MSGQNVRPRPDRRGAHRLSVDDRFKIANGGATLPSLAEILTHDALDNLVAFLESRVTM